MTRTTLPLLMTALMALAACNTAGGGQAAAPGTTAPVGEDAGPCPQGSDLTSTGTCVTDESED
ncbi:hypothetical protein [Jannaschia marina]|uniref:hypothetical protein n=1 Tax=Jannaschia marina TaxID=2741674 RepID=UPI0015CB2F5C|nr:hypothetical protein [Jannaschia marina]